MIAPGKPILARDILALADTIYAEQRAPLGDGMVGSVGAAGRSIGLDPRQAMQYPFKTCVAHNDSAYTLDPFEYAVIKTSIYTQESPARWESQHWLSIDAASTAEDDGAAFVIIIDPLSPGQTGRVAVMGMTYAYVLGTSTDSADYTRAAVSHASPYGALTLAESGAAEVIWRDDTATITTPHLALIRFPSGTGGGGMTFYTAPAKPSLPEVDAPALGFTTITQRYYGRIGSASLGQWLCLSHTEEA